MYYAYLLQSEVDNRFHSGYTQNLKLRFERHNKGFVDSSKDRHPFKLTDYEASLNQQGALRRKKHLKTSHGKRFLHKRIKYYLTG